MRVVRCCLVVLLSTALHVCGATDGKPAGLDLVVLPTIQYAHDDIWAKTPSERGPTNMAVSKVVRDQAVHILVFATHYAIGVDQNAEVNYRISFVRPDGRIEVAKTGLQLIPRGPAQAGFVRKAAETTVFVATKDDPLGDWGVVVEATDVVGALTARSEQHFTVVADEPWDESLPPATDVGHWLQTYHDNPRPQQLLAVLRLAVENPPPGAKPHWYAENGTLLGFFEQVLSDNPWLLPHVIARLEKTDGPEREFLTLLLAYAKRDDHAFPDRQPEAVRDAIRTHQYESWPVPTTEPLQGAQLDVLWGRFFAGGHFEPIRALVGVLAYYPYKDAVAEYKKLAKKPTQPPVELYKGVVFGTALWSLTSNIQQDKVVRDYCEGILIRQELPEAQRPWLAGAFRIAVENLRKAEVAGKIQPQ